MLRHFTWKYRRRRRKSSGTTDSSTFGSFRSCFQQRSISVEKSCSKIFSSAFAKIFRTAVVLLLLVCWNKTTNFGVVAQEATATFTPKTLSDCLDDLANGISCYLKKGKHVVETQRYIDLTGVTMPAGGLFLKPEPEAATTTKSPLIDGLKDITGDLTWVPCAGTAFASQCMVDGIYTAPVTNAVVLQLFNNSTYAKRENRWNRRMFIPARWPNPKISGATKRSDSPFSTGKGADTTVPIWSGLFNKDDSWSKMRHSERKRPSPYQHAVWDTIDNAWTNVFQPSLGSDQMLPTDPSVRDTWGHGYGWSGC